MSEKKSRKVEMIDVITGYSCNSGCIFCALDDEKRSLVMTTKQILHKLSYYIKRNTPSKVRFGGGEATIRRDFISLIKYCKKKQIRTISVQTNGYMLANKKYLNELIKNGLNKVNISFRSVKKDTYAKLTRVEKSYELSMMAIDNCIEQGIELEVDALITVYLLEEINDFINFFKSKNVNNINFWFISHEGRALKRTKELVPKISYAAEKLNFVFSKFSDMNLRVFYIPYCFFPNHRSKVWNPVEENTLVITPENEFLLEKGKIDLGIKS